MKTHLLNILQSRKTVTIDELRMLLGCNESSILHLIFRLQEDKHNIRIEQGYVYIDKVPDMWAFVSGVLAVSLLVLVVLM